jgi:hypothetical protein
MDQQFRAGHVTAPLNCIAATGAVAANVTPVQQVTQGLTLNEWAAITAIGSALVSAAYTLYKWYMYHKDKTDQEE